jgi:hypothetical protein
MVNFEKCVKNGGKIYYWNSETGRISEIVIKEINVSDCPEIVVLDLIRLLDSEKEKHGKA